MLAALPPLLAGIGEIAPRYDGFILDAWGTLYDGGQPLPGVLDALSRLKAADKRLVVLSNSPQRARVVVGRLAGIGIGPDLVDAVVTSGEMTHAGLRDRPDAFHRALGRRAFYLAPERYPDLLEGTGFVPVEEVAAADFLLVPGPASGRDTPGALASYEGLLADALGRGLPMVCANPDREVIDRGTLKICAGALAERYAAAGGLVRAHGKPDPAAFAAALDALGPLDRRRVLVVGDGLPTDIAGALAARLDALFIAEGLHWEELRADGAAPALDRDRLARALSRLAGRPAWVAPRLAW